MNRQALGRRETNLASQGELSSVRSGDTMMNNCTYVISFRVIPAQDMGFCDGNNVLASMLS
jgi:hypothetical protein